MTASSRNVPSPEFLIDAGAMKPAGTMTLPVYRLASRLIWGIGFVAIALSILGIAIDELWMVVVAMSGQVAFYGGFAIGVTLQRYRTKSPEYRRASWISTTIIWGIPGIYILALFLWSSRSTAETWWLWGALMAAQISSMIGQFVGRRLEARRSDEHDAWVRQHGFPV